jgi:hypothetical protein
MNLKYQKLIDLINCAINEEDYHEPLTEEDFQLLRYNQLSGSIYPVLKDQTPEILDMFKKEHFLYIKRDTTQMSLIQELRDILNRNEIDFVFLKGSYLKTIYPSSHMRIMGDIDVLVKPKDMNKVHEILKENHYHNYLNSSNHDCFSKLKITIEIHPKLDSDFDDEYKPLFLEPWTYTQHVGNHEYELSIEYNFVYHIYHMIKHLYHSGVGYRTMLDLYVFLNVNLERFNLNKYHSLYKAFPKKEFIDFTIHTIDILFSNIELKHLVQSETMITKNVDPFITYLFESGTHGINESHNMFIGSMANQRKKHELTFITKTKFLLSKVFLNLSTMKGMYKYLNRFPFLLPFAWIQRMFRLMFRKDSRDKLKYLSVDKTQLDAVNELFDVIGI